MQFRNNINALRALAVIAVVLFHFKIAGFNGGFTGVDVFFVISGFLMTGIIATGLRAGDFSLWGFYASRAHRIIPALALVCAALMVFGFACLPLDAFREALASVRNSVLFLSNFSFAKRGNYFDAPLHENWLLHTWSLSVEWQFYLLYPLVLMGLFKYLDERKTRLALLGLCAASLGASILATGADPVFAFYMLPTRAWEMMAGGLVFLFPMTLSRGVRAAFEGLGLACILAGVHLFSERDPWPGCFAILPVLGTALVIYANTDSAVSRNPALQFAGKVSYSVYLWHWPVVVFLYTCGLLGSAVHVGCAILLSLALGSLSYYLVESRAKKPGSLPRAVFRYGGAAAFLAMAAAAGLFVVKDHPQVLLTFGEQGRPEYTSKLYKQECYANPFEAADCKLGTGTVSVILFGDSHAGSTAAALQEDNSNAALLWARGGCPNLVDFQMQDKAMEEECRRFHQAKFAALKDSYPEIPVVLFSRGALYLDRTRDNRFRVYFKGDTRQDENAFAETYTAEYAKTVCMLAAQRPVWIVRPVPEMPVNVYKGLQLQSRVFGGKSDIAVALADHEKRTRLANTAIDVAAKQCHARVVDPVPYLCPEGKCMGSKNGEPLYFDDNHLVDAGNEQLRGLFNELLNARQADQP